jgi:hypothetical protein
MNKRNKQPPVSVVIDDGDNKLNNNNNLPRDRFPAPNLREADGHTTLTRCESKRYKPVMVIMMIVVVVMIMITILLVVIM